LERTSFEVSSEGIGEPREHEPELERELELLEDFDVILPRMGSFDESTTSPRPLKFSRMRGIAIPTDGQGSSRKRE
jgi:hypothetical protein